MRIAYLSIGGHIHTERWLRYFIDRGHEVHLITVNPVPLEGATVHDLRTGIGWKPLHYALGILKLRRILKQIKPDLLHTHFLQGYGYWSIFAGVRPMGLTVWGDDVYEAPYLSRLRMWMSQRALAMASFVTGDSQDILDELVKIGADRDKLHLVLWGVELEKFKPVDGSAFRKKWNISSDAAVAISMRSFSRHYYNIETIMDSVPSIVERVPGTIVVFAAYDGEGDLLAQRARDLGVEKSVRIVGCIDHAELPVALGASDVFISVPSLDATAVSLLEAMATGKGIVVSDLPSNREWITDGENGRIVPAKDISALADATVDLLTDEEKRSQFGKRCIETAHKHFNYHDNMSRVEDLCTALVRDN